MDSKEADLLSQVLGVLLEGQELDQERLHQLEERLQQIVETTPTAHQPSSSPSPAGEEDPFGAVTSPMPPEPQQSGPSSADPFAAAEPAEEPQGKAAPANESPLETELGLLKEELKEAKEKAEKFEQLYRRKEEEVSSQQQMIEMTVNHVMADLQEAQEKLLALDDMRRMLAGLRRETFGASEQLQEWFPKSFFWSQQEASNLPYQYYCLQQFSIKYILAVSIPCDGRYREVMALALQLLLHARVAADRYSNPSLIYEFYEQLMNKLSKQLDMEFEQPLQGVVIAIDEEAHEVALSGNGLLIYQQEGNLVKSFELGPMSAGDAYRMGNSGKFKIRRFPRKSDDKFLLPLSVEPPEAFNNYLRELGNLSSPTQQEHLQQWREQGEFPEGFAFLSLHID